MANSGIAFDKSDLEALRAAWRTFGADLSFDLSVNNGLCVIENCVGMSFVGLRTERGPRPVCLRHYDEVLAGSVGLTA